MARSAAANGRSPRRTPTINSPARSPRNTSGTVCSTAGGSPEALATYHAIGSHPSKRRPKLGRYSWPAIVSGSVPIELRTNSTPATTVSATSHRHRGLTGRPAVVSGAIPAASSSQPTALPGRWTARIAPQTANPTPIARLVTRYPSTASRNDRRPATARTTATTVSAPASAAVLAAAQASRRCVLMHPSWGLAGWNGWGQAPNVTRRFPGRPGGRPQPFGIRWDVRGRHRFNPLEDAMSTLTTQAPAMTARDTRTLRRVGSALLLPLGPLVVAALRGALPNFSAADSPDDQPDRRPPRPPGRRAVVRGGCPAFADSLGTGGRPAGPATRTGTEPARRRAARTGVRRPAVLRR